MNSIFNADDNKLIIERINHLKMDTKPLWGKMTVSQMLMHCRQPLLVASGELRLNRGLMGILFGNWAKKKLTGPEPFQKNLPTDKSFIVKEDKNFEEEKSALLNLIHKFEKTGQNIITTQTHPFFGKLTAEQWDILQVKHLDHHLRQFGV